MLRYGQVRYRCLRQIISFLTSERALLNTFWLFIIIVVGFGVLYWCLTPFEHGIRQGSEIPSEFSLLQGIYFSVVTVSSLGYGDLHPVGVSKFLASLEVLLGLLLIGIMIAALTSQKLSHLVSRLFVSDAQRRLKEFAATFNKSRQHFQQLLNRFSQVYQVTPKAAEGANNTNEVVSEFRDSVSDLMSSSNDLRDYIRDESAEKEYFEMIPGAAILEMLGSVVEALAMLRQCIISLPSASHPEVLLNILSKENRSSIMHSVKMQREVCEFGINSTEDQEVHGSFKRLQQECEDVSNCIPQTPTGEQPDQVLYDSDTPQD